MTGLLDSLRARAFLPFPVEATTTGRPRLTGVEIEFGGLDTDEAAGVLQEELGGDARPIGPHEIHIENSEIGDLEVVLDTRFRDRDAGAVKTAALDMASAVVPVEVVTAPLTRDQMQRLDAAREKLREAGATGTRDGVLLGFGVHLNPEVPDLGAGTVIAVLQAFALLEDWLRADAGIDRSRRILPFVEPYPPSFVDGLAKPDAPRNLPDLIDLYLAETPSRNRGLDALPLFRHLDEDRVVAALGSGADAVKARPAWHFRLPDCRIDESGWSLAEAWNRWRLVECVAADAALLGRLRTAWRDHRAQPFAGRAAWTDTVAGLLESTGATEAPS